MSTSDLPLGTRFKSHFASSGTILFFIITAHFILALVSLEMESLHRDEDLILIWATAPDITSVILFNDSGRVNPPFYPLLMYFWVLLVGYDSLALLRFPSIIFSSLTVIATYFIGKEVQSSRVGLTSAFFVATSQLTLRFAQEFRFYSLAICLSTLTALFYLKSRKESRFLSLFFITGTLALYTHLTTSAILVALVVYEIINQLHKYRGRKIDSRVVMIRLSPFLGILVAFLPFLSLMFLSEPFLFDSIPLTRIIESSWYGLLSYGFLHLNPGPETWLITVFASNVFIIITVFIVLTNYKKVLTEELLFTLICFLSGWGLLSLLSLGGVRGTRLHYKLTGVPFYWLTLVLVYRKSGIFSSLTKNVKEIYEIALAEKTAASLWKSIKGIRGDSLVAVSLVISLIIPVLNGVYYNTVIHNYSETDWQEVGSFLENQTNRNFTVIVNPHPGLLTGYYRGEVLAPGDTLPPIMINGSEAGAGKLFDVTEKRGYELFVTTRAGQELDYLKNYEYIWLVQDTVSKGLSKEYTDWLRANTVVITEIMMGHVLLVMYRQK